MRYDLVKRRPLAQRAAAVAALSASFVVTLMRRFDAAEVEVCVLKGGDWHIFDSYGDAATCMEDAARELFDDLPDNADTDHFYVDLVASALRVARLMLADVYGQEVGV